VATRAKPKAAEAAQPRRISVLSTSSPHSDVAGISCDLFGLHFDECGVSLYSSPDSDELIEHLVKQLVANHICPRISDDIQLARSQVTDRHDDLLLSSADDKNSLEKPSTMATLRADQRHLLPLHDDPNLRRTTATHYQSGADVEGGSYLWIVTFAAQHTNLRLVLTFTQHPALCNTRI
jgi:hypothetical protein